MSRLRNSRGQAVAAGGAASLIALIALLIIVYVILLPPDVREELLENDSDDNGNGNAEDLARILVEEDTGTLDKLGQDQFEHHLSAINLFTTTSATVLFEVDAVYVKWGVFDKLFQQIDFTVDDVDSVDDVLLSMRASKRSGMLTVKLNGRNIVSSEIPEYPSPFRINPKHLQEENTLEFQVSGVGFMFWHTNEYLLENLKITADVTDASQQESSSTFSVTREEKDNIETVELRFYPDCRISDSGRLEVLLNNHRIFDSVPDCGSVNIVDLSVGYINEGTNKLSFKADKGYYLIDQIKVKTELAEITYPIYYFELGADDMEEIEDENLEVNMTFDFVDDTEFKSATIFVNGRRLSMNTRDAHYSRDITSYVEVGNNAVKIEPESDHIDIIEFKILLQEVD